MKTPTYTALPVALDRLVRRFEVQQRCPLQGWNTWVIYDEKRHADEECARRISEASLRDKNNWRVISSPNAKATSKEGGQP